MTLRTTITTYLGTTPKTGSMKGIIDNLDSTITKVTKVTSFTKNGPKTLTDTSTKKK